MKRYGSKTREEWLAAVERARAAAVEHGRLGEWEDACAAVRSGPYFTGQGMKMSAECAAVVKDLIDEEDFITLDEPWRGLVGEHG